MCRLEGDKGQAIRVGSAAVVLLLGTINTFAAELVGVPRILEGDRVEIAGRELYLEGIDAPELAQVCVDGKINSWECGKEAREQLIKKAGGRSWTCELRGQDGLGRFIASCLVGGDDIASWMVRSGWALSFKHCSREYKAEEAKARQAGVGLWAGAFIAPRDWRNRNRFTTILGVVRVPTNAHHYLLPLHIPMDFEVRTPKPSCFPTSQVGTTKVLGKTQSVRTATGNQSKNGHMVEQPAAVESGKNCKRDLGCFAKKHGQEATKACEKPIEQLAKFDFRWINRWYESKFDKARWRNRTADIITYIGDKIEFKDELGHWFRHEYECDFDGTTRRVLDVRAQSKHSLADGQ